MIEYAPLSPIELSIEEAWLYCVTLEYNGYHDWRMPTIHEYITDPEIPTVTFDDDVPRILKNRGLVYSRKVKPVRDIND